MIRSIRKHYCYKSDHAKNRTLIFYIMTYTAVRICTLYIQYTSTQYRHNVEDTCPVRFSVPFISFILPTSSLLKLDYFFLFGRYLLLSAIPFYIFLFVHFIFHSSSFPFYISIRFLSHYILLHGILVRPRQWLRQLCERRRTENRHRFHRFFKSRMAASTLWARLESPARAWPIPKSYNVVLAELIWTVGLAFTSAS